MSFNINQIPLIMKYFLLTVLLLSYHAEMMYGQNLPDYLKGERTFENVPLPSNVQTNMRTNSGRPYTLVFTYDGDCQNVYADKVIKYLRATEVSELFHQMGISLVVHHSKVHPSVARNELAIPKDILQGTNAVPAFHLYRVDSQGNPRKLIAHAGYVPRHQFSTWLIQHTQNLNASL